MPILPEHKEILLTQSKSKTLPQWQEYFGNQYTKRQIYSFCYHNNKSVKKNSEEEHNTIQRYNINQDYFKTWSCNMAYIFGFWCAVGCIYQGQMFDITIHKKDKYILKKIAEELKYEGNLYDSVNKQVSRINFNCVEVYKDIVNLGGKEFKSLDLIFPNIPSEYLSDFIRGYFDGNGNIWKIKGRRINTAFVCPNKRFLNTLWDILKNEANVEGGSYNPLDCSLKFGKKDSLKIGEYIYKNSPELFLKRKYDKFIL